VQTLPFMYLVLHHLISFFLNVLHTQLAVARLTYGFICKSCKQESQRNLKDACPKFAGSNYSMYKKYFDKIVQPITSARSLLHTLKSHRLLQNKLSMRNCKPRMVKIICPFFLYLPSSSCLSNALPRKSLRALARACTPPPHPHYIHAN
jgi:hypothetical protein